MFTKNNLYTKSFNPVFIRKSSKVIYLTDTLLNQQYKCLKKIYKFKKLFHKQYQEIYIN